MVDYPQGAASVRDKIKDLLAPAADEGKGMDTGGGFGRADLWVWIDGVEYFVSVKPTESSAEITSRFIGQVDMEAVAAQQRYLQEVSGMLSADQATSQNSALNSWYTPADIAPKKAN